MSEIIDARDFYALLRFEEAALALRTVFELDLVDRIGTRSLAQHEFQNEFRFTRQAARTIGALLGTMNVLEISGDLRVQTTELARACLGRDSEFSRRPYLEMGGHPEVDEFIRVLRGECEELPPALYGRDSEPETLMDVDAVAEAVSFGLASRAKCFAEPLASAIAVNVEPEHVTLADIGAGSPYVALACKEAMPHLKTIRLVDRSNGMKYVQQMLDQIGENAHSGQIDLCEQDFFESVPPADIYNISNTAHDWLEAEYIEIMSNVRKGISPSGLVCIHEPLLVTSWGTKEEWFEALWMACYAVTLFRLTRGKGSCYSVDEHDAIQNEVGFSRSADPIRTVDGCTALFYQLADSDQDSTFSRKIGKLHDSKVRKTQRQRGTSRTKAKRAPA